MTFSVVARDVDTGDFGVAVASKFLAVGSVVPRARADVGAVATQALANVRYGADALAALAAGGEAAAVVASLTGADPGAAERQLGVVGPTGDGATFTGDGCLPWAGGRMGPGVAVQGNILTGPEVVDAVLASFLATGGRFPDRLVAALLAGDRAGGERRGRQSAALLVVRAEAGYNGGDDRWIDLRVDDHPDPVPELGRLLGVWRTLMDRPEPEDLLDIDAALADELRLRLTRGGWAPGGDDAFRAAIRSSTDVVPRIGEPRDGSPEWDGAWDAALIGWMGVANLEARTAALGRIDPVVLDALREATSEV